MSFSQPEHQSRRVVQLTPLIDLMFILIIFFVTTTTFRTEERQIDVSLAATQSGKTMEPQRTEIVVNVKADGGIYIGNRPMEPDELNQMLRRLVKDFPNERVIVRGDKNVRYERVLVVIDAARSAGVKDVQIATTRKSAEAGG